MNWRSVLVASVMATLGFAVLTGAVAQQPQQRPAAPAAEQKPLKEAIVGSWRLLIDDALQADGTQVPQYGPNPRGILIFGPEGRYSLQIARDIGRPKFAANDRLKGAPEEMKAAFEGMISHFGGYSVSDQDKSLTFRIEASSYPNWNDTTQKRSITALWQDDFTYTNATPSSQTLGGTAVLAWRRIK